MELTFGKRFPEAMKQIKQCNVLVIGNTGTGKSTLIGELFDTKINDTVTRTISEKPYKKPGLAIAVYDAPGLEKDKKQQEKVKQEVAKFIKQQKRKEPEEQIHAVWYCVNSQVTKESEIDQTWLDTIAKEVPIIAVITRSSGIEEEWLKPFLEESVSSVGRVVQIMALQEKTHHYNIQPHGLDSLLFATEDLLEELARTAISNAINAKADSAFGWCKAGCVEVFSARLFPIPFFQGQVTALFQTWMLAEIAKTFGYEFDKTFLRNIITAGVGVAGFDSFLEQVLNNFPGMNQDNIQTVQGVLSQSVTMLNQVTGDLPFHGQLLELLGSFDDFNPVGGLPIFKCVTAIATTLSTGILGLAFIEAMKAYKQAEYEGQPLPKLEEIFQDQMRQSMDSFRCWFGGDLPVLQPVLQ